MKRFVMTIALACVLSASALAGEIPSVGFTAPPPDETTPTTNAPATGEVPTVGYEQQMSEATLSLIQALLGAVI